MFRSMSIMSSAIVLSFASPAFAGDAGAEIANAAMHAGLAAQASDLAGVHAHLHHAVNCLVGPAGTGFDAKELNPCANSGGGAIPDTTKASTKATLQAALGKANAGIAAADLVSGQRQASAAAALLKKAK